MDLLIGDERSRLIELLKKLPGINQQDARDELLAGLPLALRNSIPNSDIPNVHLSHIIEGVTGDAWWQLPNRGPLALDIVVQNARQMAEGSLLDAPLEQLIAPIVARTGAPRAPAYRPLPVEPLPPAPVVPPPSPPPVRTPTPPPPRRADPAPPAGFLRIEPLPDEHPAPPAVSWSYAQPEPPAPPEILLGRREIVSAALTRLWSRPGCLLLAIGLPLLLGTLVLFFATNGAPDNGQLYFGLMLPAGVGVGLLLWYLIRNR